MLSTLATALLIAMAPLAPATDTVDVPDLNGQVAEDAPGWDCRTGGNRVCGPDGDDAGHTPGCYDDAGALVALWPCYVVTNADGSADVYTPEAV